MPQLRPALSSHALLHAATRLVRTRVVRSVAVVAAVVTLGAFESPQRIEDEIIRPLPRTFRLAVIEGDLTPVEAQFRRSGDTYVNEAPTTDGSNIMRASWFAVHEADSDAILIEYPATDAAGATVYRVEYALEVDRNRYRLYELNQERMVAALDALESAVRRNDMRRGDRRRYENLTRIWNAHVSHRTSVPGEDFRVSELDDINALIDFSRRLDDGAKVITSTGYTVELYVR